MVKLIPIVTTANLIERIVGQFAFMKAMSEVNDANYYELNRVDLNQVYDLAWLYFPNFEDIPGIIESETCNLDKKITKFLSRWASVTDVTAIQQNIHFQLQKLD